METYLDHPQHGAQVVHTKADLEQALARGWVLRDPQPGAAVKPSPNPIAQQDIPPRAPTATTRKRKAT
jgi:hypothetical protein